MAPLWGNAVALAAILRGLVQPRPRPTSTEQRLAMLPRSVPAARPVTIHWDSHQIPFVEAQSDEDLAAGLGVVHAHLRLAQVELLRRVALGRVSELVGPRGVALDHTMRLFGFARPVPGIIAMLPDATLSWVEGFVAGFNHDVAHLARAKTLPHEFAVLGMAPEPWTVADLFTMARLISADVNWRVLGRLLRARAAVSAEAWRELWPMLLEGAGTEAWTEGGALGADEAMAEAALTHSARSNSNSAALAAGRSATGAAMIASDPHLPITVPSVWLIAGMRSPGINAVGLMLPGLPFVALGRNPWIAWGGTSLHAASSELFDASGEALSERYETIRVRGAGEHRIRIRESRLGPIVSDGALLWDGTPLALRWAGDRPTDELTAMLGVARARNWDDFRVALAGFAVPGQTMVYAGTDGRVGQVLAAHLPRRQPGPPAGLLAEPARAAEWDHLVTGAELPAMIDPRSGFIASANANPGPTPVPVGFFFSQCDRVERMSALLGGEAKLDVADMERLHRDVCQPGALRLRDCFLAHLPPRNGDRVQPRFVCVLAGWDGCYTLESTSAAAYELLFASLVARLWPEERIAPIRAVWTTRQLLARKLLSMDAGQLEAAMAPALAEAARRLRRYRNWGGLHRLRLRHIFAEVPGLGWRYSFGGFPTEGGNETLHKTGFPLSRGRHVVAFGSGARHLSNLADPDDNRFVLLGGQDGGFGSANFLDQVPIWRKGGYVRLPLRVETVRATFPHRTVLEPV